MEIHHFATVSRRVPARGGMAPPTPPTARPVGGGQWAQMGRGGHTRVAGAPVRALYNPRWHSYFYITLGP